MPDSDLCPVGILFCRDEFSSENNGFTAEPTDLPVIIDDNSITIVINDDIFLELSYSEAKRLAHVLLNGRFTH